MAPLLTVEHLTKRFGGLTAVNDVSFTVEEGDFLGIIGPNGAGKTTLFNLITGFLPPDAGEVRFKDQPITGWKAYKISRLGMTRTFQITKPFGHLDVKENVVVAALQTSSTLREARERAEGVLRFVGLESYRDRSITHLPMGLKKKLELAKALATRPSLLFLDEVMGGLASDEVQDMMEVLRKVRESGVTLIMIEHVLQAITQLSERLLVLHHGAKLAHGSTREVIRDPEVVEAYLGEVDPDAVH
ncbi:ABC transporter ATP-binding protein [Marinithermofilum abyssi]|uniref:ABC transporter ATP-binding protein n=1 Tax=Marinithermofilum abyssi TaxID=1571185 RepID=A0A8J2YAK6_9BACL|nr:ABC transporter ATP-binding protein [Marinithermofilum abyssi]GGE15479.1 ABC transporter ATP-binding protein [Marinithermofilum abyssi]